MDGPHEKARDARVARLGRYAAIQALAEISLGSVVHAFHVPLGGHLLSLNQGLILTLASRHASGRREGASTANAISSVAAFLKTLSPAGSRVAPMLAISMQGLLFSAGVATLGLNVAGIAAGMALLSVWGFLQPLGVAYLIFGGSFFEAIQKSWLELARLLAIDPAWGAWILLAAVASKALAAIAVGAAAWRSGASLEARYLREIHRLRPLAPAARAGVSPRAGGLARLPAWRASLADLLRPWFLASLALSVGFFVLSGRPALSGTLLYALRAAAVAWLAFWAARSIPVAWLERWLGPGVAAAVTHLDQLGRDADGDLVRVVAAEAKPDRAPEL